MVNVVGLFTFYLILLLLGIIVFKRLGDLDRKINAKPSPIIQSLLFVFFGHYRLRLSHGYTAQRILAIYAIRRGTKPQRKWLALGSCIYFFHHECMWFREGLAKEAFTDGFQDVNVKARFLLLLSLGLLAMRGNRYRLPKRGHVVPRRTKPTLEYKGWIATLLPPEMAF